MNLRAVLFTSSMLMVGACVGPEDRPATQDVSSPTPGIYPSWARTTWAGTMLERYDEHVSASTNLRFNIEEQDGATFQALIYHCFGYLIIDGTEVPDNTGFWLDGQFLGNNQLTLYGTYYGHALSVQVEYLIGENPSDMLWFVHLSLDDDFYDVDLMMGDSAYVEFTY